MPSSPWRIVAASSLALALLACNGRDAEESNRASTSTRAIELRDATGRSVRLERPARRIVSLAPSLTETLFAIGAGPLVKGRTSHCNYPADARAIPVVSDMATPSYEELLRLKPDLVLMTFVGNSSAAYDRLVDLGMRPFAVAAETIPATLAAIDTIGILVGRRDEARTVIGGIRRTLDSIAALASARPPVTAFIVLDRSPLMTVSGGFVNEALELAGGTNIAAGDIAAYPRFSREEVLRRDPDVIIIPSDSAVSAASLVESFPEWSRLRAIRTGAIRAISPDILFRPGPRLGEAVKALHAALHSG